jgi:hypothetical protein
MTVIDSRDLGRIRGFDIRAELHPDPDTRPQDFDCYTSADIQAWQHDQWSYVTTKITAARAGVELGAAYLSGSEHGYLPGVDRQVSPLDGDGEAFVNGYGPGLIDEAITEAEKTLTAIQSN